VAGISITELSESAIFACRIIALRNAMNSVKKSRPARRTIAVFSAQLSRVWGAEFMNGVLDAAEARDVNVVCLVAGRPAGIHAQAETAQPPAQPGVSNGLYDLVKPDQFDGLLLAADLAHALTAEEMLAFARRYSSLPIAAYAIPVEGITSFIGDNIGGMRAVIRHLVEVHGFRRIAFLQGPRGQVESEQRLQAYREELTAHDILYDQSLVVEGDFTPESGRLAVRTLLDERGLQFQALAAANDRMAFGALDALQQRGIKVPDDLALTGFDDVREAASMGVPLTTVHQSFYGAGGKVLEALIRRMDGEQPEPLTVLPVQLVVRWSCGCLPESTRKAVVQSKEVALTGRLENKRDAAIRALLASAGIPESETDVEAYRDVFGRTWDAFLAGLHNPAGADAFLKMLQAMIEALQRGGRADPAAWHNVLSTLRKYALGGIPDPDRKLQAENLFQQARMLVGELSQRAQAYRRLQAEQQEELLGNFGFSMAPAMNLQEIGSAIAKHFPPMGIRHWYAMFYSEPDSGELLSSPQPEPYRLLLQYDDGRIEIPHEAKEVAAGRLLPPGRIPRDRYSALVMPLGLAGNRFGFMWTQIDSRDWDMYVRVKNLVSSALLRATLAQQREQAQREVERLLADARKRAAELAIAHDLAQQTAAENARLYEEVTRFNQELERLVAQRLEELKAAYQSLEQHDKNKSAFIQVAAHELRTPLTLIMGYVGMLEAEPTVEGSAALREAVGGVLRGAHRLHEVLNSMLDVVKLENQVLDLHPQPVSISSILRRIQASYGEDLSARQLTMSVDENSPPLPTLMADAELLQKALDHVVVNAIKFTPNGGAITISTRSVSDERLGSCAEIRVSDTGIGIDPEHHQIIFEKLHQLGKVELHSTSRTNFKGGGPGLGLAIASGIISAHGGRIWVESAGHDEHRLPGSTFFVRVPLANGS